MKTYFPKVKAKLSLKRPSKKRALQLTLYGLIFALLFISGFLISFFSYIGQNSVWDQISGTEEQLRGLYSTSTQIELRKLLPDESMNFTEILIWQSQRMNYTEFRPKYENAVEVLENEKGACGEFALVFGALCAANNIPFRLITVGYFFPNIVDHAWAQVNPSHDGKTWIQVEVTDTCDQLRKGNTIEQLWNQTINNNSYYFKNNYKMVLAYQLNENDEIIITDVTSTFSSPK
jgi:hypothetical protein